MRDGSGEKEPVRGTPMKYAVNLALLAAGLLLVGCASVPYDGGVAEVRENLSRRGIGDVEWKSEPDARDDERVGALLTGELTADEAVAIAAMNNPRLQVALAELGIARADLIEASTISNPLFEFEIRFPGEPYRPYELRLAQSLVDLILLPRRRALGRAGFAAAQLRISSEVLRFAGDVRGAYFELLAATQDVALTGTSAYAAQTAADVAIRQHAAGNITDLDLENEQAVYEQAKLELASSERRAIVAREALIRAMGLRDPRTEWRLPPAFPPLPDSERDQEELERLAAAQRLDLAIARGELDIAQQRIPLARLEVLDEIVLDYHYEREPDGARTSGPGIEFPIPIFNSGRAARSRAEAEFLRARHALGALELEAASQLRVGRARVHEARARVEYYRDVVVPRRGRILELTKLEHNAMLIGVFSLLEAKRNELQAQRDFIEAQREYWSARTDLDLAVYGAGDDTTFMPVTTRGAGKRAQVGSRGGH
jgi:outer membrane protein, heavy metal efflux system